MPKVAEEHKAKTELFTRTRAEVVKLAGEEKNGGDKSCSVIALAIMTDQPVDIVASALKIAGRKDGGGATDEEIAAALKTLGFEKRANNDFKSVIANYPGVHKALKNVTTHHPVRFATEFKDFGDCLMFTKGHILAFKDGQIHDHTRGLPKRVRAVWTLTPIKGFKGIDKKAIAAEVAAIEAKAKEVEKETETETEKADA